MPILNLHEFTIQMLLLPSWLTMMCTVQCSIVFLEEKSNNNGLFLCILAIFLPTTLARSAKMCYKLFNLWSRLHRQWWRTFLMWMILHQELIGWCLVVNSTWCIAFSIERNITKCPGSFSEVQRERLKNVSVKYEFVFQAKSPHAVAINFAQFMFCIRHVLDLTSVHASNQIKKFLLDTCCVS